MKGIGSQLLVASLLTIAFSALGGESSTFMRGCYMANWAQYRPDEGSYLPKYYESGLCSHVFLAFAKMNDNFEVMPSEWNDVDQFYRVMQDFKKRDPNLKVLLSLGGWSFGTKKFEEVSRSPRKRNAFAGSLLKFLTKHGFDGFDLDWEFPSEPKEMVRLCKEISQRFKWHKRKQGKELIFSAAVSASPYKIEQSYDIPALSKYLDFVNVMTYDYHGAWENKTNVNSPLRSFPSSGVNLDTVSSVDLWHRMGMPKHKIIIGLPTYGRGWTLLDELRTEVGEQAIGPSEEMYYTREKGVIAYYECCELIGSGAKMLRTNESPILIFKNQWFSYDDQETFKIKLKWLKEEKYGGAFIWSLDLDDFKGTFCEHHNGTRYPLTRLMKEILEDKEE